MPKFGTQNPRFTLSALLASVVLGSPLMAQTALPLEPATESDKSAERFSYLQNIPLNPMELQAEPLKDNNRNLALEWDIKILGMRDFSLTGGLTMIDSPSDIYSQMPNPFEIKNPAGKGKKLFPFISFGYENANPSGTSLGMEARIHANASSHYTYSVLPRYSTSTKGAQSEADLGQSIQSIFIERHAYDEITPYLTIEMKFSF